MVPLAVYIPAAGYGIKLVVFGLITIVPCRLWFWVPAIHATDTTTLVLSRAIVVAFAGIIIPLTNDFKGRWTFSRSDWCWVPAGPPTYVAALLCPGTVAVTGTVIGGLRLALGFYVWALAGFDCWFWIPAVPTTDITTFLLSRAVIITFAGIVSP